jgi:hypothetical protein
MKRAAAHPLNRPANRHDRSIVPAVVRSLPNLRAFSRRKGPSCGGPFAPGACFEPARDGRAEHRDGDGDEFPELDGPRGNEGDQAQLLGGYSGDQRSEAVRRDLVGRGVEVGVPLAVLEFDCGEQLPVVASNPSGSTNIDLAASADGKFLYTLNTSAGKIGVFAVDALTGRLTNLGAQGEIPTSAGANGIAAN